MANNACQLVIGANMRTGLDLLSARRQVGTSGYVLDVMHDGAAIGPAEMRTVIAASLLQDGSDLRVTGHGNRTLQLTVQASAANAQGLADAERDIVLAGSQRTRLFFQPPDEGGPTTVFSVLAVSVQMSLDRSGDEVPSNSSELLHRYYPLELTCLPFAESVEPVSVLFAPGTGTVVALDTCISRAAWTAGTATYYLGQSVLAFGGAVGFDYTGSVSSASNYTWLDVATGPSTGPPNVFMAGIHPTASAPAPSSPAGCIRYYFTDNLPTGPRRFAIQGGIFDPPDPVQYYVGGIGTSTSIPVGGVPSVLVKGSARSPASLVISHASIPLGDVFLYSDPTMLSTGWNPDDNDTWQLAPSDSYMVYVKLPAGVSPGDAISVQVAGARPVLTRAPSWVTSSTFFPVGKLPLAGNRSGTVGIKTFTTKRNGTAVPPSPSPAQIRLFRAADETSLTYVRAVTGTDLTLDIPSIERPRGGLWSSGVSVLNNADAWGLPMLIPPTTSIWFEASGTTAAKLAAEYTARWHFFAAE